MANKLMIMMGYAASICRQVSDHRVSQPTANLLNTKDR